MFKRERVLLKFVCLFLFLVAGETYGQNVYRYSVDMNRVDNDMLKVQLLTPKVSRQKIVFSFPKIIPGTYSISDYGKFISDLKAFDNAGKELKVSRLSENKWEIASAERLYKITYRVEDIFDTEKPHDIYAMAATNIEENKNFVFNTPGFFGFLDGFSKNNFELSFEKPNDFFASTSLKPVASTPQKDVFLVSGVDELYDHPIMYSLPDTATIRVGNCEVLVSVYSPNHVIRSGDIASWLYPLLEAAQSYLGGKLPADKYSFLYYFKDGKLKQSFKPGQGGALEHTTSSFYYLPEVAPEQIKGSIVDISSHEFFHIITPLTISSKEVKEFNWDTPVLSKHLWLYEGSTEYTAHHVQVRNGLKSVKQFLDKLSEKITLSRTEYNDTLAFTKLSKESAGKYADEYGNVYQKGALIAACLDIYLLHLSEGRYGFRNLTYDLGIRYGKERYFDDDELFSEIGKLTYPEIKDFLEKYVGGSSPIPYEYFFGLAGIRFTPKTEQKIWSLGGFYAAPNKNGIFTILPDTKLNEFGRKMGYAIGDEIYAINRAMVTPQSFGKIVDSLKKSFREGDILEVRVGRKNEKGGIDTLLLRQPVFMVSQTELNKLDPVQQASARQKLVQKAWLEGNQNTGSRIAAEAKREDVESVDAIVKALYDVISGPAGSRNWERFYSLFTGEARMGAAVTQPNGKTVFVTMSPEDYKKGNDPFFKQSGFFEEEIKKKVDQYGNIALVQSAYQFRLAPGGPVQERGVNYFTLVNSDGRWWVANLVWQEEGPGNPLPESFLKK